MCIYNTVSTVMAEIINQNQLYWPKINILDTLFFFF